MTDIKIIFESFSQYAINRSECDLCEEEACGFLKFTTPNKEYESESIFVCVKHGDSITPDNPLLIPYLKLCSAIC